MTDQADMEARATAIAAKFGFWGPGAVKAMLAFEAERGAEREAAAYERAAGLEALVERIYWMTTSRASPKKRAAHIRWMIEKHRGGGSQ